MFFLVFLLPIITLSFDAMQFMTHHVNNPQTNGSWVVPSCTT